MHDQLYEAELRTSGCVSSSKTAAVGSFPTVGATQVAGRSEIRGGSMRKTRQPARQLTLRAEAVKARGCRLGQAGDASNAGIRIGRRLDLKRR
jgi:hypothetical protein